MEAKTPTIQRAAHANTCRRGEPEASFHSYLSSLTASKGWIASSSRMSKTFGIDFPFDLVVRWNPASALSTKDDVLFSGSGFVMHRPFFIPLVVICLFLIGAHRNGSRVIITTASSLSTPHRGGIPEHPPPHGARVRALRHRGP